MGEGQGSRRVCGGWRWGTSVLSAHRVGPCPLGTGSGSLLPEGVAASTCLWSWGPMPWTSLMLMVLARPPPRPPLLQLLSWGPSPSGPKLRQQQMSLPQVPSSATSRKGCCAPGCPLPSHTGEGSRSGPQRPQPSPLPV